MNELEKRIWERLSRGRQALLSPDHAVRRLKLCTKSTWQVNVPASRHKAAAEASKKQSTAASPRQSTTAASPKQSTTTASPKQSNTATSPKQSTATTSPKQSTAAHSDPRTTIKSSKKSNRKDTNDHVTRETRCASEAPPRILDTLYGVTLLVIGRGRISFGFWFQIAGTLGCAMCAMGHALHAV